MSYPYSPEEVLRLARKSLEIEDDPDEEMPEFYLAAFQIHLSSYPLDTNFILELSKSASSGGRGFGTATCMEDYCWRDIVLGPDPSTPGGGKKRGFGSLWEYQVHCREAEHEKGREERCKKQGISTTTPSIPSATPVPPHGRSLPPLQNQAPSSSSRSHLDILEGLLPPSSSLAAPSSSSSSTRQPPSSPTSYAYSRRYQQPPSTTDPRSLSSIVPGPSRYLPSSSQTTARNHATHAPSSSLTSESRYSQTQENMGSLTSSTSRGLSREAKSLSEIDLNRPPPAVAASKSAPRKDVKLDLRTLNRGKDKSEPILILDSDDEDVLELTGDAIPEEMRRVTNKANPFELSDSEDEENTVHLPSSSRAPVPSSSQQSWVDKLKRSLDQPPAWKQAAKKPSASSSTAPTKDRRSLTPVVEIPARNTSTTEQKPAMVPIPQTRPSGNALLPVPPPAGDAVSTPAQQMTDDERKALLSTEENEVRAVLMSARETFGLQTPLYRALSARYGDILKMGALLRSRPYQFQYRPANANLLAIYPEWQQYADRFGNDVILLYRMAFGVHMPEATVLKHVKDRIGYLPSNITPPSVPGAYPNQSAIAGPSNLDVLAGPSTRPDLKPVISSNGLPFPGYLDSISSSSSSRPSVYPMPGEEGYDSDNDPYAEYRHEASLPYGQDLKDYFAETVDGWQDDADIEGALKKLGLDTIDDRFSDMTIRLMPHQCLGVAWMLEKERDRKYRGGLLCDAMGLGKTVQMIATIVGNKSKDKKVKTTLVVAPLALLSQWKAEIESKTTPGLLNVVIHHGPGKVKSAARLKQYDVVLTTYGTLTAEMGNDDKLDAAKKKRKKRRAAPGLEDFVEHDESSEDEGVRRKEKGPLFKTQWYRVVLDEAHTIRNRNTRMAKACFDVDAVMRWSLTGTLIVNTLDDLYTQLRFTGISPCKDFAHYRNHIGKLQSRKPRLATKRAQAILRGCMMRRNKDSTLNGRKLLELPPKETQIETIDFSPDERLIYDAIEQKMQLRFTNFLKKGTLLKHMSCILVMLTRLRQLCDHPWLLRRNPGDPAHPNDFTVGDEDLFRNLDPPPAEDPEELNRAVKVMGQAWVDDVSDKLKARRDKSAQAAKRDEEAEKDMECAICLDFMQDEVVVNCKHSFCRGCISEIFTNAPRDEDEMTDDQAQRGARKCPMCRAVIEKEKVFAAGALLPAEEVDEEASSSGSSGTEDRKGKRRMADVDELEDEKPNVKRISLGGEKSRKGKEKAGEVDMDAGENVLPSTKMKYLANLLDQFLAEPDVKVIVFSQFTTFLDLVSTHLYSMNINHQLYIGTMNRHEREEAVRKFTAPITGDMSPRVMLISLKCGGVGLNLTAASKVVSLDLAWNTATEEQAVDRAHRIGQTKPVDVRRVVISNSVEQRILALQEAKKALADGAMGEGDGGKLGRLSVGDLIKLFNVDTEALYRDED